MKEEITNIIRTFEAVGPILGNALKSSQLFRTECELTEPDPDILCEYDVKIPTPPYKKSVDCNHGKHVLHFGGKYDSYQLVPKIPSGEI